MREILYIGTYLYLSTYLRDQIFYMKLPQPLFCHILFLELWGEDFRDFVTTQLKSNMMGSNYFFKIVN